MRPNIAEVLISPEAMPIIKRPKANQAALGAIEEMAKPKMTKIIPICKVRRNPKLLLIRPRKSKVARQPNI